MKKEQKNYNLLIGSHVSFSAPNFLIGSINEMLSYNANCLMLYTGAPQNTIRKPLNKENIIKGKEILKNNNIDMNNVIVHAPYIINLCSDKIETRILAIEFLKKEIIRCMELGAKFLVLHPGSRLSQDLKTAIKQIHYGINEVLNSLETNVVICIETMAGKGSEVGRNIHEIKEILSGIDKQKNIGVCLDTCHLNDAGYNIDEFDQFIDEFDKLIGIDKVKVIHLNDSKNPLNAHKDRHENLGYGYIKFNSLLKVVYHPKLDNIPKILETPYVIFDKNEKKIALPPYKYEIQMIRDYEWFDYKKIMK